MSPEAVPQQAAEVDMRATPQKASGTQGAAKPKRSAAAKKQSKAMRRRLLRWTRRVHMYLGLFLLPWVLLYGVTAFLFNHPDVMNSHESWNLSGEDFAGRFAELPPAPDLATQVVEALNAAEGSERFVLRAADDAHFRGGISWRMTDTAHTHTLRYTPGADNGLLRSFERTPPDTTPFTGLRLREFSRPLLTHLEGEGEEVVRAHGLGFERTEVRAGPRLELEVEADGQPWQLSVDLGRDRIAARPLGEPSRDISFRSFLLRLHLAHTYPDEAGVATLWAVIVDIMAATMVLWVITGLVMWWQLKSQRGPGGITLALSLGCGAALFLSMYALMVS